MPKIVAKVRKLCHLSAMAGNIRALVSTLLAAEKTIEGTPDWRAAGNGDEMRLLLPVFVDGRSTQATVEIDAYPNAPVERFRIMLNLEKCIWRIDFNEYEQHLNPIDTWSEITPSSFREPHYHSWSDNQRYCTSSSLPKKLLIARPLPEKIRQFSSAFRWFCGEVKIAQPPSLMLSLPQRTKLL